MTVPCVCGRQFATNKGKAAHRGARGTCPGLPEIPTGTRVEVWPGVRPGRSFTTRTRGETWECGGTAVVNVEDRSGGVALTHVRFITEEEL